jgi:hypothetical protein
MIERVCYSAFRHVLASYAGNKPGGFGHVGVSYLGLAGETGDELVAVILVRNPAGVPAIKEDPAQQFG